MKLYGHVNRVPAVRSFAPLGLKPERGAYPQEAFRTQKQGGEADRDQDEGDRTRQDLGRVPGEENQRAAQVLIDHAAQNDAEDQRRHRVAHEAHQEPEHPESQHDLHVEKPLGQRVGTQYAESEDYLNVFKMLCQEEAKHKNILETLYDDFMATQGD